jgi:hypothetical protein
MGRVGDRKGKSGGALFDRPKPTAGCSANGRKKKKNQQMLAVYKN